MDIVTRFIYFFFFNDTATTEIYTLSLHDALPIWCTMVKLVDEATGEGDAGETSLPVGGW